jgi:hypothetical protein
MPRAAQTRPAQTRPAPPPVVGNLAMQNDDWSEF